MAPSTDLASPTTLTRWIVLQKARGHKAEQKLQNLYRLSWRPTVANLGPKVSVAYAPDFLAPKQSLSKILPKINFCQNFLFDTV